MGQPNRSARGNGRLGVPLRDADRIAICDRDRLARPEEGQGTWLRADFHTHTEFTDGLHSVETVVAAAAKHGCDVVAITDHGDRSRKTGTPEYLDAIRAARTRHPDITVIAGMEWNVLKWLAIELFTKSAAAA